MSLLDPKIPAFNIKTDSFDIETYSKAVSFPSLIPDRDIKDAT